MSNDEERQEKRGFKVEDRRRFSDSGEPRSEGAGSTPPESTATGAAEHGPTGQKAAAAEPRHPDPLLTDLNFSTFVISLSTQALAHLGEIENPIDRSMAVDLGAAKQLIDILGILKDKTKGNLDTTEAGLLDNMLYDLRLRYVERVRRSEKA
ncbi:MAG TPA: DUF1844 domain-containing protein [Candidatus Margulisiibacteriota bacterium]|nr:DUF1844 domain-containing protein [Candidatus Margulisiibacteriota bacterium]